MLPSGNKPLIYFLTLQVKIKLYFILRIVFTDKIAEDVIQASFRRVRISLGLIGESVDIERNGNSFRVHVNGHVERKRDAKKENESNVESRRASGHETHVSIFDISICERARVSTCLPAR